MNSADLVAVFQYASPPVVGAFIGYLTNAVAIKMLFRPLKPWHFAGFRLPFTPGVIPGKRHDLAINIGDMVGEHLLTSQEISQALTNEAFQDHLYGLIEGRGNALMQQDLGTVSSLIPKGYQSYYDVAVKTLTHHVQEGIHAYVASSAFASVVEAGLEQQLDRLLSAGIKDVFPEVHRAAGYAVIDKSLTRMLAAPAMEQWVETFVCRKVTALLAEEKTLADILPPSLQEQLVKTIEGQAPVLLDQLAVLLRDPEIREKIVHGVRAMVESFISSMGPMAGMIKGFLSMETVERKVRDYLIDNEDEIGGWLQNADVRSRVVNILGERSRSFLATPLAGMTSDKGGHFCAQLSLQLTALLREPETTAAVSSMVRSNLEAYLDGGGLSCGEVLWDLAGDTGINKGKAWVKKEVLSLLRSGDTKKKLNLMTQTLVLGLLSRPIGRLADLLPVGVRDGLYQSLRRVASDMLLAEVPGLVASLNLRHIITEKVDSLDLMRLERLLLSIMEEQFKYINLFGAILGFIIGGLNVVLLIVF